MQAHATDAAGCHRARDAVSAHLDGEAALPDAERAHVASCDGCRAWAEAVGPDGVLATLVLAARAEAPDRAASLLVALADQASDAVDERLRQVRVLLGLAGAVMLALAVPALLGLGEVQLGDVLLADLGVHAARDAAVFQAAVGVGFLAVAHRPARAGGLFPVVAIVALLTTITTSVDLARGTATVGQEVTHLVELVGAGLLWLMARRDPDARRLAFST